MIADKEKRNYLNIAKKKKGGRKIENNHVEQVFLCVFQTVKQYITIKKKFSICMKTNSKSICVYYSYI